MTGRETGNKKNKWEAIQWRREWRDGGLAVSGKDNKVQTVGPNALKSGIGVASWSYEFLILFRESLDQLVSSNRG